MNQIFVRFPVLVLAGFALVLVFSGCSDNADELGVGAECAVADDCNQDGIAQQCLQQFKGGYCGVTGCASNADCPTDSACVTHDDGQNYCFRTCQSKDECNANRAVDNEANCSSSVDFTDGDMGYKACVPPSA